VRHTKGLLVLVLGTLAQHDLVIGVIGMGDLRIVLIITLLLNQMLLSCADVFQNLQYAEHCISCLAQKTIVLETSAMWYGKWHGLQMQ
jgi:hypothetical protein